MAKFGDMVAMFGNMVAKFGDIRWLSLGKYGG